MAIAASPETKGSSRTRGPLPRTPGRVAALVIGVPVCLALVGSTGLNLLANFAQGSYPVSYQAPAATTALTLNLDGDVTIKSAAAGQATLTGTARYTFARGDLTEQTVGGDTTVGYHCPISISGNCGVDGTVTVPATITALTAHSGSGGATVTGLTGPVILSTGSGNLSVGHVSGPLALNTDSGNIQVSATESATLSASTGSGGILVTGVTSPTVTVNTDSGSIEASGVSATAITASTGSGDIVIKFTAVPRDVRVNTDSGNIILLLPPGSTKYNVTANTDSGSKSDTLPQSTSSDHVITASTGSGNITISQQ